MIWTLFFLAPAGLMVFAKVPRGLAMTAGLFPASDPRCVPVLEIDCEASVVDWLPFSPVVDAGKVALPSKARRRRSSAIIAIKARTMVAITICLDNCSSGRWEKRAQPS